MIGSEEVYPPSTISVAPDIKLARSERRNEMALATSSGLPSRPSGVTEAELEEAVVVMSVLIQPGATEFARMFRDPKLQARLRVKLAMAALDAA